MQMRRMVSVRRRELEPLDVAALEFWPTYLATARPRQVRFNVRVDPVILYVDGAEEDDGVGIGAAAFFPEDGVWETFGGGWCRKRQ